MSGDRTTGVSDDLRRTAEQRIDQHGKPADGSLEPAALARSIHELLIHQVELEVQNEELLEARTELEGNAELLTELYDFAPVGYFSISPNGVIRQLNLMGARMLNRERAHLFERPFTDFLSRDDRMTFELFLSRIFASEDPCLCEVTLLRSGQSNLIANLTGTLSSNSLVCRMAAMDVTNQRRAEAAVREKIEDLDCIFNLSHDLLAITGDDGRFRRVNPAFERVLGYGEEILTGGGFLKFVHPDDRDATLRELAGLRAGREVTDFVNRYRCADGSWRWLEWRVTPYGKELQYAVARDITERKEAVDALRRSEEKFRSIVESSTSAMYLYQLGTDGRLVLMDANPAADKELGIAHRPLLGMTLEQAFPKLAGTPIPGVFMAVAKGELCGQQFETEYHHEEISGYFEVLVFQTCPGTIAVVFSNVSARKSARETLERHQEELEMRVQRRTAQLNERTRQLRALADELTHAEERERGRIAGLIHEDVQQMLVAALLNLELLKSTAASQETARDFAHIEGILRDSIRAARSLTAELSPPVLQQCGLAAALKWLRTWCGEKYAMDLSVDVDDAADPGPEVSVVLFRCVRELLFNTVKHAGVRSAALRMWRANKGLAKIEVSDEGAGFDPEEVRAREGSVGGFGLFSIRERLEWSGGGFEIDSSPGHGSRFTLWVPLKTDTRESAVL